MDPLLVRTFGITERNPLHSTPGTRAQDFMLNVFTEGIGHYKNNQIECDIQAGSIAFFLPDDPGILYSDQQNPYTHYFCRFNGGYASEFVHRIIKMWGKQIMPSDKIADIVLILKKMKHEIRHDLSETMRTQEGFLFQILFLLLDNNPGSEKTDRHMKIVEYLENRIDQNINFIEMAKIFHLSVRHLNRLFQQNMGVSISQYHEMIRLNLSKTLLKNTNFSIQDISLRVGYQDALYFSRVFKKNTKLSPQNWRKNFKTSKIE